MTTTKLPHLKKILLMYANSLPLLIIASMPPNAAKSVDSFGNPLLFHFIRDKAALGGLRAVRLPLSFVSPGAGLERKKKRTSTNAGEQKRARGEHKTLFLPLLLLPPAARVRRLRSSVALGEGPRAGGGGGGGGGRRRRERYSLSSPAGRESHKNTLNFGGKVSPSIARKGSIWLKVALFL